MDILVRYNKELKSSKIRKAEEIAQKYKRYPKGSIQTVKFTEINTDLFDLLSLVSHYLQTVFEINGQHIYIAEALKIMECSLSESKEACRECPYFRDYQLLANQLQQKSIDYSMWYKIMNDYNHLVVEENRGYLIIDTEKFIDEITRQAKLLGLLCNEFVSPHLNTLQTLSSFVKLKRKEEKGEEPEERLIMSKQFQQRLSPKNRQALIKEKLSQEITISSDDQAFPFEAQNISVYVETKNIHLYFTLIPKEGIEREQPHLYHLTVNLPDNIAVNTRMETLIQKQKDFYLFSFIFCFPSIKMIENIEDISIKINEPTEHAEEPYDYLYI